MSLLANSYIIRSGAMAGYGGSWVRDFRKGREMMRRGAVLMNLSHETENISDSPIPILPDWNLANLWERLGWFDEKNNPENHYMKA